MSSSALKSAVTSDTAALVGVAGVLLAAQTPNPILSASMAAGGLALLGLVLKASHRSSAPMLLPVAGLLIAVFLVFARDSRVGPLPPVEFALRPFWEGLIMAGVLALVLSGLWKKWRTVGIVAIVVAATVMTVVMTVVEWDSELGIDVYHAHRAAGAALLDGLNPYGPAVRVLDGSPNAAPGSVIVGYPYPPVVLLTYGVSAMLADPRLVSLLAWLVLLGWLGRMALRDERYSDVALAFLVLLAAAPVWPVVLFTSWTEPVSLLLLVLAASLWRSRPILGAVLLGLALASKQYFVLLTPLLLLSPGFRRVKHLPLALGVAGATLLPFILVDAVAFWEATVTNIASIGFRPDTQSVSGLLAAVGVDLVLPVWVWLLVCFSFGIALARGLRSEGDLLLGVTLVLGVAFLTGLAFPNYWFLVAGLGAAGVVLSQGSLGDQGSPREKVEAFP